ncbi:hypothetical protein T02_5434 [Trichinella nativa]|uniref:Uncharacterized protein n=1 Tax=Trichinella nativa TaxID=6335 RepID=A0A0V1KQV5_9BILA|nr:hypothetical protein T02_5434 [Trichinella nativa]
MSSNKRERGQNVNPVCNDRCLSLKAQSELPASTTKVYGFLLKNLLNDAAEKPILRTASAYYRTSRPFKACEI